MTFTTINYKYNGLEEAQALTDIVDSKLEAFAKYLNEETAVKCDVEFEKPHPHLFSFNHPLGACSECNGFGKILDGRIERRRQLAALFGLPELLVRRALVRQRVLVGVAAEAGLDGRHHPLVRRLRPAGLRAASRSQRRRASP